MSESFARALRPVDPIWDTPAAVSGDGSRLAVRRTSITPARPMNVALSEGGGGEGDLHLEAHSPAAFPLQRRLTTKGLSSAIPARQLSLLNFDALAAATAGSQRGTGGRTFGAAALDIPRVSIDGLASTRTSLDGRRANLDRPAAAGDLSGSAAPFAAAAVSTPRRPSADPDAPPHDSEGAVAALAVSAPGASLGASRRVNNASTPRRRSVDPAAASLGDDGEDTVAALARCAPPPSPLPPPLFSLSRPLHAHAYPSHGVGQVCADKAVSAYQLVAALARFAPQAALPFTIIQRDRL